MENTELKIGTRVRYTRTSVLKESTNEESIVTGFYNDGSLHYVCLMNGDKMFKEALTIVIEKYKIVYTSVKKGMQVIKDLTKEEMLQQVLNLNEELDIMNLYVEKTN